MAGSLGDPVGVVGRRVIEAGRRRRYLAFHRRSASAARRALTRTLGRPEDPRHRRQAEEYAIEVLGDRRFADWLRVYALTQDRFVEGWIPADYFSSVVLPLRNGGFSSLPTIKSLSRTFLGTALLPDLAQWVNGRLYRPDWTALRVDDLKREAAERWPEVYLKADGSYRGMGVRRLPIDELTEQALARLGNCVVQEPVSPHPDLAAFGTAAVPTLRVVTTRETDGTTAVRGAVLRLGRAGTQWLDGAASLLVGVSGTDGGLSPTGYLSSWDAIPGHPDTGVRFAGRAVPEFARVQSECANLHDTLPPHFSIIGWDVTVSDAGEVRLLEWNGGISVGMLEAVVGPCFRGLDWERLHADEPASGR